MSAWQRLVTVMLQIYGNGGDLEHLGGAQLAPLVQLSGELAVPVHVHSTTGIVLALFRYVFRMTGLGAGVRIPLATAKSGVL